ncbi:MAG: glycogen/starch/alpha-glucan phosphorylase [Holdemania massiliensis]
MVDGTWAEDHDEFKLIFDELMYKNDEYLLLADFASYTAAHEEIQRRYADRGQWAKACLINIAKSGYFSSDRTIQQYADEIWHISPVRIDDK